MSVKTKLITCSYCEGTGRELNHFDPPVTEFKERLSSWEPERSPSGREILDEPCSVCNGTRKIRVVDR